MAERTLEDPTAFAAPGFIWGRLKPALARIVLIAPAAPADTFNKNVIFATVLTDPTAKRVKS